jgi:hypothetical protein
MKVEWKKVLGAAAPLLATALGGPLAGAAASAISRQLLGKPDASIEEIAEVVASGSPEVLLALKQAEQSFKLEMEKLDLDYERIIRDDRDSARKREAEVKDNTPKVLAAVAVLSVVLALAMLIFVTIPPGVREAVFLIVGTLLGSYKDVFGYYFGSSSGSSRKSATLDETLKVLREKQ